MTRKQKLIFSTGSIIIGWLLNAFAWTTTLGHPISTISLLTGLGLFLFGIVFLILAFIIK